MRSCALFSVLIAFGVILCFILQHRGENGWILNSVCAWLSCPGLGSLLGLQNAAWLWMRLLRASSLLCSHSKNGPFFEPREAKLEPWPNLCGSAGFCNDRHCLLHSLDRKHLCVPTPPLRWRPSNQLRWGSVVLAAPLKQPVGRRLGFHLPEVAPAAG